ncbi:TetR family transcriptional regulator [Lentzea atacamensis]|uniref:TetR family transcriptional regulator n=2 Tax=Lentzea TaxID=165301 RepID=A0A316HZ38_9PSEU|nr:TetR/AcrR family transcriptional regulator [Lentzea atacamensis]PWK85655.1 TetR family transcriptional regulator [Lentzea atacamensis]RAS67046.1 TetR family transcriptional regulator [Lentzea atacamensis]
MIDSTHLPLIGEGPNLRADAVRNRARLLEAAARLAASHGAAAITMESVAAEAGVGKGTVSRRFGDRNGLLQALLDHSEQLFQAAFLSGPPPLGPDADAAARLRAFGPALLRHERAHLDLYLAAEPDPARRFAVPARRVRHTHVAALVRAVLPDADAEVLAHTLLSSVDVVLVDHLVRNHGMSPERVEAGWHDLVDRLVTRG